MKIDSQFVKSLVNVLDHKLIIMPQGEKLVKDGNSEFFLIT